MVQNQGNNCAKKKLATFSLFPLLLSLFLLPLSFPFYNSLYFSSSPHCICSFLSLKISRSFSFIFFSFALPFLPFISPLLLFCSNLSLYTFAHVNCKPRILRVQHTTCLQTFSPCTFSFFFSCFIGSSFS